MALDPADQRTLDRLVADLQELHGESLLAVALTGEAASDDYEPGKTPLAVVVVLAEVTPGALRTTRGRVRGWRRRRIPPPVLMDPRYIETSLDVFPLEFMEIASRHVLLFGDDDPFRAPSIDPGHLRLEVEEQLRGKLLHLWEAYLATEGSRRQLRALLAETPAGFEMALRGVLRLRRTDSDTPADDASGGEAIVANVERSFDIELPTLRRLEALRRGHGALPDDELETVFEGYLADVRRLVQLSDAL